MPELQNGCIPDGFIEKLSINPIVTERNQGAHEMTEEKPKETNMDNVQEIKAQINTKDGIIYCDPIFLAPETSKPRNTFKGHDARCIVCLEPCYSLWIEDNAPPPGCFAGHTKASDCQDHAVPKALFRGQMAELRKRGMIK